MMCSSSADETKTGFIAEVKSYIPPLTRNIEGLRQQPDQEELLEETHRLVHTIKGASSMVGLKGLSRIALQMETAVEAVIDGRLPCNHGLLKAMATSVNQFNTYCDCYFNGGAAVRKMIEEAVLAYSALPGDPIGGRDKSLATLLQDVPEYEMGTARGAAGEFENEMIDDPATLDDLDLEAVPEIDQAALTESGGQQGPLEPESPAILPELLESFFQEAEGHLADLGQTLNGLDSVVEKAMAISPQMREDIRRIRRSVHTLKGAAAVMGFQDFAGFAHELEDLLDWLFESASEITPEIVAVLVQACDLLEPMIADPALAKSEKAVAVGGKYRKIMASGTGAETTAENIVASEKAGKGDNLARVPESAEHDPAQPDSDRQKSADRPSLFGRTLRVDMERVDNLVNLSGELIIASSAFDQQMDKMKEAVAELELTRDRLRSIARELEISYEVKALERLGSSINFARSTASGSLPALGFEDFDSMELDRYSELNLIIRTLNESVVDIGAIHNQINGLYSEFDGHLTRQRVILSELQDKMMRVRMTPMSVITNRLHRTVREVAGALDKKVRLDITGSDIELDRLVWDKIIDPLMHLLRNAVDHGIESAQVRAQRSKPRVGKIGLSAARRGNQVVLEIRDDGGGLDYEAIRETVRRFGLAGRVNEIPEGQLADYIFRPGFSTCTQISAVSGRGVGMDVVRENIQDLKGTIRIVSETGRGTRFTIRIPLTLAAVQALLFTAAGQILAMPLNEVKEIIRLEAENRMVPSENLVRVKDKVLPIVDLAQQLQTGNESDPAGAASSNPIVLITEAGDRSVALAVDTLMGQREIVIKNLGSHLRHVKGISGVTILGDGSVVPILNIEDFFRAESNAAQSVLSSNSIASSTPLKIMIVDDSVSIRQVVSRLLINHGWIAETAKDGVDALEKMREFAPDLVVLDIEMPRMNGFEFLSAIRAQEDTRQLPVVMLSSRTGGKHRDKAIGLGANGFMSKPYNEEEFTRLITKLTGKG